MSYKDPAKRKAYNKEYHDLHKGIAKGQVATRYQLNKETYSKRNKEWRNNHKAELREYRKKNRDKIRTQKKFYRLTNENKIKNAWRIRKYGIDSEKFDLMVSLQNNRCAICGDLFTEERPPALDHSHRTGKLRGILHRQCNSGLGMFQDNPDILKMATEYLLKMEGEESGENI